MSMAGPALNHTAERKAQTSNGGLILMVLLAAIVGASWGLIDSISTAERGGEPGAIIVVYVLLLVTAVIATAGFYTLQPNEGAAITLFGNYKGTDRTPGLRWVIPWYGRKKISLRVRNVTGEKLKVNDRRGNPIEIAAVVV
jgi:hypothetical protein